MEGKNTWNHLPCQTVHATGSNTGCCMSHPEWPHKKAYPTEQMEEPTLVAFQPYTWTLNSCLSKRLARHKITSIYVLPKNSSSFHYPMKDDLGLKCLGSYSICPCKCRQVYSGQIGQSIMTGATEHNRRIQLGQPAMSAATEQRSKHNHCIQLHSSTCKSTSMERVSELQLQPNNMNRKDGLIFNRSCKLLIHCHLRQYSRTIFPMVAMLVVPSRTTS